MGEKTNIGWTDSSWSHWHGCTKVANAPACEHCYAEAVNKRGGHSNWGRGAPRRLLSEHARNEIHRWHRNADKFFAEHGRKRRVFCSSMSDAFDNEVPAEWRAAMYADLEAASNVEVQILTKRIPNVAKMVPASWKAVHYAQDMASNPGRGLGLIPTKPLIPIGGWPQHIGLMITVVTQAEADRDVPRLLNAKRDFGIPWVGISYEPAMEIIDWRQWLNVIPVMTSSMSAITGDMVGPTTTHWEPSYKMSDPDRTPIKPELDWIIFGGESGAGWRTFDGFWDAARQTRDQCAAAGTAFFMKQCAAFRPTDDMIPADLMIRQWPEGH